MLVMLGIFMLPLAIREAWQNMAIWNVGRKREYTRK